MMTRYRFDSDFGFSYLTRCLSIERAPGQTASDAVAYALRGWGGDPPGATPAAVLDDTLRLLESALPSDVLTTLWLTATRRGHDLEHFGIDGRDWLRQIADMCVNQLRTVNPSFTATTPEAASDALAEVVLDELAQIAPELTAVIERSSSSAPLYKVSGAVPVLEQTIALVDPDLGFRLLLRALSAYWVPISQARFDRYEALGERFGFGEFLVNEVHHLTQKGV